MLAENYLINVYVMVINGPHFTETYTLSSVCSKNLKYTLVYCKIFSFGLTVRKSM